MQSNVTLASPDNDSPSYISRVINNDAVRKGLAGAAAAVLIGVVQEALWPSK